MKFNCYCFLCLNEFKDTFFTEFLSDYFWVDLKYYFGGSKFSLAISFTPCMYDRDIY